MFNKSQIMKRAWEIVSKVRYSLINMRYAMYQAWAEAKRALLTAKEAAQLAIRSSIAVIENKSRLSASDYQRINTLRGQLAEAA